MTHARRSFSHVLGAVAAAEQDGPPEALRAARLEARAFLQATVPNRHHLGQAIARNTPSLVALLLDIHGPAAFGDVPASGTIRHVLGAAIRLGTVAPEILDILDRARLLGEMDAPEICDAALHADCPDLLAMATRLAGSTRTALDGCAPIPAAIACGPTLAPLLGAEMADRLGDPALPHAGMDVKEAALFAVLGHDLRPLAASATLRVAEICRATGSAHARLTWAAGADFVDLLGRPATATFFGVRGDDRPPGR